MQRSKHIVSIILLLIMLVVGFKFVLFQSYIHSQKSEFRKTTIEKGSDKLRHLTFTDKTIYENINGYEWKHHNKELVINGQFHEVLAVIKKQGGYEVIVIADSAENELFKHFFSTESKKDNSIALHLIQFLQLSFFENNSVQIPENFVSDLVYTPFKANSLSQEHLHELIKPPSTFIL